MQKRDEDMPCDEEGLVVEEKLNSGRFKFCWWSLRDRMDWMTAGDVTRMFREQDARSFSGDLKRMDVQIIWTAEA